MDASDQITVAFDEYVAAFKAGDGDPTPFLERFQGEDRRELEVLVDTFLESGPRAKVDLSGQPDEQVEAVADAVMARISGRSGALAELLLGLRGELLLKQSDVVSELATAFDASPEEREKIDGYYHDLEWGTLPASGVGDGVLDTLARILKTNRERLREAGRALGPSQASATGPVFARMADDAEFELEGVASMESPEATGEARRSDPPDRIDQLFTGG